MNGNPRNSNGKSGAVLLGLFFGLMGCGAIGLGIYVIRQHLLLRDWVKTPCVIERFEIKADPQGQPVYSPDLVFHYEIDGHRHTGTKVWAQGHADDEYEALGQAMEVMTSPANVASTCVVNPKQPQEAALLTTTNPSWAGPMLIVVGCVVLALGASVAVGSPLGFLLSFFGIFAVVGYGLLAGWITKAVNEASDDKPWVEVPAEVIWSRVRMVPGDKSTTYRPEIFYQYAYQGRVRRSNCYERQTSSSSNRDKSQAVVDAYPAKHKFTCWVHPDQAWRASIRSDVGEGGMLLPILAIPCAGVGTIGICFGLLKGRRGTKAAA